MTKFLYHKKILYFHFYVAKKISTSSFEKFNRSKNILILFFLLVFIKSKLVLWIEVAGINSQFNSYCSPLCLCIRAEIPTIITLLMLSKRRHQITDLYSALSNRPRFRCKWEIIQKRITVQIDKIIFNNFCIFCTKTL